MAAARVEGFLDYLSALKQSNVACDNQQLLRQCIADISAAPNVSMEVAATLLRRLAASDAVPDTWREQLVATLQAKVHTHATQGGEQKEKAAVQTCQALDAYFLEEEWANMRAGSFSARMSLVVNRMADLGLVNADENTYVHALSVVYLSGHKGPVQDLRISGFAALNALRDLKKLVRAQRKRGLVHSGVALYPRDPLELPKAVHQLAFGDKVPLPSPLDPKSLLYMQNSLPARATHTSVRGSSSVAPQNLGAQMQEMHMFQQFQNFAKFMSEQSGQAQADAEPVITYFQPHRGGAGKLQDGVDGMQAGQAPGENTEVTPAQQEAAPVPERKRLANVAASSGSAKSVEDMAKEIQGVLALTSAKKQKKEKEKEKAEQPHAPQKVKAKATGKAKAKALLAKGADEDPKREDLPFPGIEKQEPLRHEKASIYVCPNSMSFRVKVHGQRCDRSFSWKARTADAAWNNLQEYLASL